MTAAGGDPPRPRVDDGRDLLFLTDLHLAAGPAGLVDRFTHDEAVVRLLGRFDADAPLVRVVLLGDFLDFLEAAPAPGPIDPSDAETLRRLDAIVAAHRPVFDALGRFLALGGAVTLLPGNHDAELLRPAVRARLREHLAGKPPDPAIAARIEVLPWFLHIPGVVYAEHGSQYHDLNAFPTLLAPWWTGAQVEHPLGSLLAVHDAAPRGRGLVLRLQGLGSLVAPAARAALRQARLRRGPAAARYRGEVLAAEARASGLDVATLRGIHGLSEAGLPSVGRRMLRLLARRARARVPARTPVDPATAATVDECLMEAARGIDRRLVADRAEVPFIVMGHTHRPAVRPLGHAAASPWYLNCGAWTSRKRPPALSCVWLSRGGARGPIATLEAWDERTARLHPIGNRLQAARRPQGPARVVAADGGGRRPGPAEQPRPRRGLRRFSAVRDRDRGA